MGWEVQKACLIPIFPGDIWRKDSSETEELWQVVATAGDKWQAAKKLEEFLHYNQGSKIFYRMVEAWEAHQA